MSELDVKNGRCTLSDQLGRKVVFNYPLKRIVSLVPSQTEFLIDLGVEDLLVGITKFCVHPKDITKKIPKIGGTKKFRFKSIFDLKPDLIIGNKEENYQEGIERLEEHFPVFLTDIADLKGAYDMMEVLGKMVQREEEVQRLRLGIRKAFYELPEFDPIPALYLIWRSPYMTVGEDTFIHYMMELCGFQNVMKGKKRYPKITLPEISELKPRLILLSSEPYPFQEKHLKELEAQYPQSKIIMVNGEMFSWYGSRLRFVPDYFLNLRKELDATLSPVL